MKKLGANGVRVRQINREIILDAIKARDGVTAAQLARQTNLSAATCANILRDLVQSGDVVEKTEKVSNGGRPARIYINNPRQANIACVFLRQNGDRFEYRHAVTDGTGAAVREGEQSAASFDLSLLDALFAGIQAEFNIAAVALAIPGVVSNGVVTSCDIPALAGVDIAAHVQNATGAKVVVDNDVNFAAAAYNQMHLSDSSAGLAFLAFPPGQCPGCGLVVNNMLVRGAGNYAGEVASILPLLKREGDELSGGSGATARLAGKLAAIVVAIVNPEVVVISGGAIRRDMAEGIQRMCGSVIPERHMPRIILTEDFEEECFRGMRIMASNALSYSYKLVEADQAWC